jgi:hypothetical protein
MLQFRKKRTNDDYSEFYESVSYIEEEEEKEKFFSFYSSKKNMFIFLSTFQNFIETNFCLFFS